jgi:hypothetical protein
MSRVARRVPPDWIHPTDDRGQYVRLRDGTTFEERLREWDEESAKWLEGLQRSYDRRVWGPVPAEYRGMTFAEYAGDRPDPKDYTPRWPAARCTHWQYYEEVTEGTPLSPVFGSPEELVSWMSIHDLGVTWTGTTSRQSTHEDLLAEILQRPLRPVQ